jgi:hypothetical protein
MRPPPTVAEEGVPVRKSQEEERVFVGGNEMAERRMKEKAEDGLHETAPLVAERAAPPPVPPHVDDDVRLDVDDAAAERTPISVRDITGKVHALTVDLTNEGVANLKTKVQAVTGATPDAQCLTVEGGDGQPLEDGTQKLSACVGLESGALVHLTMQDEEQGRARREEREAEREAWLAGLHHCSSAATHEGRVGMIVSDGRRLPGPRNRWTAQRITCSGNGISRYSLSSGAANNFMLTPIGTTYAANRDWIDITEIRRPSVAEATEAARILAAYDAEMAAMAKRRRVQRCQEYVAGLVCFGVVVVLPAVLAVVFWDTWGQWVAIVAASCAGLACCFSLFLWWLIHDIGGD